MLSRTETEELSRVIPYTENELPHLAIERIESEEPSCRMSSTLMLEPRRVMP
jgi:hypothetical protein